MGSELRADSALLAEDDDVLRREREGEAKAGEQLLALVLMVEMRFKLVVRFASARGELQAEVEACEVDCSASVSRLIGGETERARLRVSCMLAKSECECEE